MSLLTGEKWSPRFKREIIIPCGQVHFDGVDVRVNDLTVSLDAPVRRPKGPVITTGDVS